MTRNPRPGGEDLLLKDGKVSAWRPTSGVLVVAMEGMVTKEVTTVLYQLCTQLSLGASEVDVWFDLWALRTYDSEVRTRCVDWLLENKPRVRTCSAVGQTKLVAMGIAAVNAQMGGMMTIYAASEAFQTALRQRCAIAKTRPMTQMFRM